MSTEDKLISAIFSDSNATRVGLAIREYHRCLSVCHPDHRETICDEIYVHFYDGGGYEKNISSDQGIRYTWVESLESNCSESYDWNI